MVISRARIGMHIATYHSRIRILVNPDEDFYGPKKEEGCETTQGGGGTR